MRTKELRAQRAALIEQARAQIAGDNPTAEQEAEFDRLMGEADKLNDKIVRAERSDTLAAELADHHRVTAEVRGTSSDQEEAAAAEQIRVFGAWLRNGLEGLEQDDRRLAVANMAPIGGLRNAQGVGTGGAGGYTVPPAFMAELLIALKAFGGVRQVAREITTTAGQDIPWPTVDDTANIGSILPENTQIGAQDMAFGTVGLKGFLYTSNLVLVSWQLLQDSEFDVPTLLRDVLATRIGRATNAHFTNGTGVGQPQGVAASAPVGKVGAAGETSTVTYDDLVDLEHSVDPAYRTNCQFMFHDTTLRGLKKLKDNEGRPLWMPGYAAKAPDTFLNYPLAINQDMPVMAAGAKSILFGDFTNYVVRNIKDVQLVRLNERYADYLQTGFFAYTRQDGRLISAGQPIKAFQNAAA